MNNQEFSKKRRNRYSIRKVTAGAASIIVGITLFASANDAQAAEQVNDGTLKHKRLNLPQVILNKQ